jgi:hypothetical protein
MDTGAPDFAMRIADLAVEVVAGRGRVSAVGCAGVGKNLCNGSKNSVDAAAKLTICADFALPGSAVPDGYLLMV